MTDARTLRVFFALLAVYGLLTLPGIWWPKYLDSPVGLLVALPYLSLYLFHQLHVPFLLQHDGACGWGWCAPTPFGWVFLVAVWLTIAWFAARVIAGVFFARGKDAPPLPRAGD